MNTQKKLELLKQNDIACITPDKDGASFHLEFMQPVDDIDLSREEMKTIWYQHGVQPGNQEMMKTNLVLTRTNFERSLVSASR